MRIKVEALYSVTGERWRLTFPNGGREILVGNRGGWTRVQSREALDIAEYLYGLVRRNVRFIHH